VFTIPHLEFRCSQGDMNERRCLHLESNQSADLSTCRIFMLTVKWQIITSTTITLSLDKVLLFFQLLIHQSLVLPLWASMRACFTMIALWVSSWLSQKHEPLQWFQIPYCVDDPGARDFYLEARSSFLFSSCSFCTTVYWPYSEGSEKLAEIFVCQNK